jgi:hypothetical protein
LKAAIFLDAFAETKVADFDPPLGTCPDHEDILPESAQSILFDRAITSTNLWFEIAMHKAIFV